MSTIQSFACTLSSMARKPVPEADKKMAAGVRLTPDVLATLKAFAEEDERTLSYLIEKAVKEYVQRRQGKRPDKPQRR